MQRRRSIVDAAFEGVPDFKMITVAVNTGEDDYSSSSGQILTKGQVLYGLSEIRKTLDKNQVTCEYIIK